MGIRLDTLTVVDCDSEKAVEWWEVVGQRTPYVSESRPGRRSYWYAGRLLDGTRHWFLASGERGGEVRTGPGAQCVVAPSLHPDTGQPYRWVGDGGEPVHPGVLPRFDRAMLDKLPSTGGGGGGHGTDGSADENAYLRDSTSKIPHGYQGRTLSILGAGWKKEGWPLELVQARVRDENQRRCDPPMSEADLRDYVFPNFEHTRPQAGRGDTRAEDAFLTAMLMAPKAEATPTTATPFDEVDLATWLKEPVKPHALLGGNSHLPERTRIMAVGASESAKSIWAMAVSCDLSRQGIHVIFVSLENPPEEDKRRLQRLRPDPAYFHLFRDVDLSLEQPEGVGKMSQLVERYPGCLVVIDTLSEVWSPGKDPNASYAKVHRDAFTAWRDLGATVLVLDHVGFPTQTPRDGVNAPRDASSKGQKADVVLQLKSTGETTFTILGGKKMKWRCGAPRPNTTDFEVIDLEDGGLDIVEVYVGDGGQNGYSPEVVAIAEAMVHVIEQAGAEGFRGTANLQAAVRGKTTDKRGAAQLLRAEVPRRTVITKVGNVEVWRLA